MDSTVCRRLKALTKVPFKVEPVKSLAMIGNGYEYIYSHVTCKDGRHNCSDFKLREHCVAKRQQKASIMCS